MTNFVTTDDLFFNRAGLDRACVERLVDEALGDADHRLVVDAELA